MQHTHERGGSLQDDESVTIGRAHACVWVEVRWLADPDGFDTFCEAEWPRLVAALDLYCGDVHVAEELAQEALIRVYERWPHVRSLESPGGWAYRVGLNLANSQLRRRQAEARARRRLEHAPPQAEAELEDLIVLRDALADLPQRARGAVVLRYLVGMPAAETGEVLGMSPEAVRVLTHRTIASLRNRVFPAAGLALEGSTDG